MFCNFFFVFLVFFMVSLGSLMAGIFLNIGILYTGLRFCLRLPGLAISLRGEAWLPAATAACEVGLSLLGAGRRRRLCPVGVKRS